MILSQQGEAIPIAPLELKQRVNDKIRQLQRKMNE